MTTSSLAITHAQNGGLVFTHIQDTESCGKQIAARLIPLIETRAEMSDDGKWTMMVLAKTKEPGSDQEISDVLLSIPCKGRRQALKMQAQVHQKLMPLSSRMLKSPLRILGIGVAAFFALTFLSGALNALSGNGPVAANVSADPAAMMQAQLNATNLPDGTTPFVFNPKIDVPKMADTTLNCAPEQ